MPEEKKQEPQKKEEEKEQTPSQDQGSTDEQKPASSEEDTSKKDEKKPEQEEDNVTVSKKELETLQNKARDFDGIIEKKRLEKLNKKETEQKEPPEQTSDLTQEQVDQMIDKKLEEGLSKVNTQAYNENLRGAYQDFVKQHPWANTDDTFSVISKKFSGQGAMGKTELLARIKSAAMTAYPDQYEKAEADRIRSEISLEEEKIQAGDSGGVSVKKGGEVKTGPTPEQIEIAKKSGNDPKEVYKDTYPKS